MYNIRGLSMQGSLADLWWISVIIIILVAAGLLLFFIRSRGFFKIGIRSTKRRLPQAVSLCIGGVIGTSVIAGALITGDSLDKMVEDQSIMALGDIDIVVMSPQFFEESVYDDLKADPDVATSTDKMAPLVVSSGAARDISSGTLESGVNIYGIDNTLYEFGSFSKGDYNHAPNLQADQCVINSVLAKNLGILSGATLKLTVKDPNPLDAFFLTSGGEGYNIELTVVEVYVNEGLGSINLQSRNTNVNNLFMRMDTMQELLDQQGKVNTIIISNTGDKYSGTEKDDEVENALWKKIDEIFGYSQVGYTALGLSDQVVLTHKDVLFERDWTDEYVQLEDLATSGLLTYFVNSMTFEDRSVSYSTVTGVDFETDRQFGEFYSSGEVLDLDGLDWNEMIITNWTSDYLDVGVGDTLAINYTVLDDNYGAVNYTLDFTIAAVVDITGKAADQWLMPDFPGIKGIDSCGNWEPPFEIDLDSVQDVDQGYWNNFQGTPKAYIGLDQAQALWSNFQGNLTHLKIKTDDAETVKLGLNQSLGGEDYGISVSTAKADQLATRAGMWILTGMFLFFGLMIVGAGVLLIVNIFLGMGLDRKKEIGILKSQGASNYSVAVVFLTEGTIYSIVSAGLGALLGLGIGWGLITALNSVWSRSVESNEVPFYFQWQTPLNAFAMGLLICLGSVMISVVLVSRMKVVDAIMERGTTKKQGRRRLSIVGNITLLVGLVACIYSIFRISDFDSVRVFFLIGPALIILGQGIFRYARGQGKKITMNISAVVLLVYVITFGIVLNGGDSTTLMTLFGLEGILIIISLFVLLVNNFDLIRNKLASMGTLGRVSVSGAGSKRGRTFLSVLSVAFVVFIIVAISVVGSYQQKSLDQNIDKQTGGWDIRAVSTIPYSDDMSEGGFDFLEDTDVLQIKSRGDLGGTCSNMNVLYPPQILGVPPEFRHNTKVTFGSTLDDRTDDTTWALLGKDQAFDDSIPIVVDMNTLVWIYGKALGDTFVVEGDLGGEYELKVIGIMDSSIYAGMFIMSQKNIELIYPLTAKYTFFLFQTSGDIAQRARDIERELADFGMDAAVAADLAEENVQFEASYMTIFQGYLVLGVLIGSAGIAVLVYRSATDRRWEIGVLKSLGLSSRDVGLAFFLEATLISVPGIVIGTVAGLLAAYMSFSIWGGAGFSFPWVSVFVIPAGIYIVSVLFSLIPAYKAAKMPPVEALRRRW